MLSTFSALTLSKALQTFMTRSSIWARVNFDMKRTPKRTCQERLGHYLKAMQTTILDSYLWLGKVKYCWMSRCDLTGSVCDVVQSENGHVPNSSETGRLAGKEPEPGERPEPWD